MATDLQNLVAIRTNLIQTLANEMALQASGGGKPSYTLDGENYQWTEWVDRMTAQINVYNTLIQNEQSPFMVTSRKRC